MIKEDGIILFVAVFIGIIFLVGIILQPTKNNNKYKNHEAVVTEVPVYKVSCGKLEHDRCIEYAVYKIIKE